MDSSLLSAHLEQIQACCHGIDSLPFPPPKIFANAMLSNHDITSLIRDTEAHERALFSVPPPPKPSSAAATRPTEDQGEARPRKRRQTVFNVASGEVTTGPTTTTTRGGAAATAPHRRTAVAAVLGGEMHEQLRRGGEADRKGDLDVEVLLRGAEKLCGVYELPGARERIAALRARFRHGRDTTAYYEARVAEQAEQLAGMNKGWTGAAQGEEHQDRDEAGTGDDEWTEEDLRREEEEARLMERKKRELQARLRSMEKDLGGLRNM
ncbi:hypothetical protein TgHK011_008004 [Trichoderma gracile]|nr:hypothetical protein TgHK011_008004 [Trichoderma gracile]